MKRRPSKRTQPKAAPAMVDLSGFFRQCPACKLIKGGNEFGARHMSENLIRGQSHCRTCR
jgi:hypothetical protein